MTIGRLAFVAGLFIMAAACLTLAGTNMSFGWLLGAAIFSFVAIYAMRQFKQEEATERQGISIGFFGGAILFMVAAMVGMAWFFSA
jgi:heme O synthase-like polyprenyltransferase